MPTRRLFAALIVVAAVCLSTPGHAASAQDFASKTFAEAQNAGRPILIAVHARWCPVCMVQKLVMNTLLWDRKFDEVIYLVVDFDRQKDQVRRFGAMTQSTLIVFRGRVEQGRSVGETDRESISELMEKVL